MSIRIDLYFKEFENPDLLEKGVVFPAIRLFSQIRFKTRKGWTDAYLAILDTGAPTCVLPLKIWSECDVVLLADHTLRGIIPKEECSLPVLVGKITCVLVDKERESDELEAIAYLAMTNDVPILIGFQGLLEVTRLYMDYRNKRAFLEIG
jgi:hypothetical protein